MQVNVEISDEKIEDLLYGHGTYEWMKSAVGDWKKGGIKCIYDLETDEEGTYKGRKTLKAEDISAGLAAMMKDVPYQFASIIEDNVDKICCDAFYQCCIFGKTVYA